MENRKNNNQENVQTASVLENPLRLHTLSSIYYPFSLCSKHIAPLMTSPKSLALRRPMPNPSLTNIGSIPFPTKAKPLCMSKISTPHIPSISIPPYSTSKKKRNPSKLLRNLQKIFSKIFFLSLTRKNQTEDLPAAVYCERKILDKESKKSPSISKKIMLIFLSKKDLTRKMRFV